jgi:hypothetical protein
VADKQDATTFVGVDLKKDCVGPAAATESGVEDSLVVKYPDIKTATRAFSIKK